MVIAVSKSKLCGISSDGGMFLNIKIYNKIDKRDCVAIDWRLYTIYKTIGRIM